jgi:hypothetical protein
LGVKGNVGRVFFRAALITSLLYSISPVYVEIQRDWSVLIDFRESHVVEGVEAALQVN